jgi:hypothetical protein
MYFEDSDENWQQEETKRQRSELEELKKIQEPFEHGYIRPDPEPLSLLPWWMQKSFKSISRDRKTAISFAVGLKDSKHVDISTRPLSPAPRNIAPLSVERLSPIIDPEEDIFGPGTEMSRPRTSNNSACTGRRTPKPGSPGSNRTVLKSADIPPLILSPNISTTIATEKRRHSLSQATPSKHSLIKITPRLSPALLSTASIAINLATRRSDVNDYKLSSSVINSPSVTPPPSISTATGGRMPLKSISGIIEPRAPDYSTTVWTSMSTNTARETKFLSSRETNNSSVDPLPNFSTVEIKRTYSPPTNTERVISRSQISVKCRHPSSFISAAAIVLPQVNTDTAMADLLQPSASTSSHSSAHSTSSIDQDISALDSPQDSPPSAEDPWPATAVHNRANSFTVSTIPDASTWSKRKPLNAKEAILRPLGTDIIPKLKQNDPLFLPVDADRLWYLGFVEEWKDFNKEVSDFWNSDKCRIALKEIKGYPIAPPHTPEQQPAGDDNGPEALTKYFQRNILELLQNIYNKLRKTSAMQDGKRRDRLYLGRAADEDLGNDEIPFTPRFVVKLEVDGEEEQETRLLGHVEYLGGRKGALTWGIQECTRNSWGSLRCVLGKLLSPIR